MLPGDTPYGCCFEHFCRVSIRFIFRAKQPAEQVGQGQGQAGAKAQHLFRAFTARLKLFSLMTSFTHCLWTSFTLSVFGGWGVGDVVEDDGGSGSASSIRDCGEPWRAEHERAMPRV